MTTSPTLQTKGRPPSPAKRKALVDAARELFLSLGVDAVTVDQVIKAAGVSRATYYRNFESRDALLAAVFAQESERIASENSVSSRRDAPLRDQLIAYGEGMMQFLADPDTMRFEPLILHVRSTQPELADGLFAAGPGRAWARLEAILAAGQARGEIGRVDPAEAVNDLVGLWIGAWRTEMTYGHRDAPGPAEQHRRARHAVDLFLRAHERAQ